MIETPSAYTFTSIFRRIFLMGEFDIYTDIQKRTNGEIYIGIVGPVRTGKSTFIKRFMDLAVIPGIEDENVRKRTIDELPMSGAGNTITTTEPKFIPGEAPVICPFDGADIKVRLIDCVGFMVNGALGLYENEKERMVKTPWSEDAIPFTKAAEIGTKKVIGEHSTIGVVVTTDGSFTDIAREAYIEPESRTIKELKTLGKPFVVLLNSAKPHSAETKELAESMSKNYGVSVLPINCDQLKKEDINHILEQVLLEFPIKEIDFCAPKWVEILSSEHWLKKSLCTTALDILDSFTYMKDTRESMNDITELKEAIDSVNLSSVNLANGKVEVTFVMSPGVYYDILSELTNTEIHNEYELISIIRSLSEKKNEFDSVKEALSEVNLSGFGMVKPIKENITLDEPVCFKNGNKYGVKIKAQVPSINMLKTNINVEIAPIVGSKLQADDLVEYIKGNTKDNPQGIWDVNIFGKTVEQIVSDGIREKTKNITGENMEKITSTLEKVMNDNSGLVCLIV